LFAAPTTFAEYFDVPEPAAQVLAPRYNITPGQPVAVVRTGSDGQRRVGALRWGLVPFWAKDATIGRRLVNARLETLTDKPAFREAAARRRCLIAASGFYEWSAAARGGRQPFFVRAAAEPLLAFAGLWERWRGPDAQTLETCVIVTTAANPLLASIHDRMPVALAREDQPLWLDPHVPVAAVAQMVRRAPQLAAWPVGLAVNDPHNDHAGLIVAAEPR
jgi:putative SOS response-associated peptidase YedK